MLAESGYFAIKISELKKWCKFRFGIAIVPTYIKQESTYIVFVWSRTKQKPLLKNTIGARNEDCGGGATC